MLFGLECRKIFRSAAFWIYCVLSVVFFATNYIGSYGGPLYDGVEGYKMTEDHDLVMSGATNVLFGEYASNKYVCYPFGFYKAVHLKESDQKRIADYLMEITGTDEKGFEGLLGQGTECHVMAGFQEQLEYMYEDMPVAEGFSYDRFTEIMTDVDNLLGGGSEYDPEKLLYYYGQVPMTEEECQAEHEAFIKDDRITGGFARLFSDYAGIDLAILPVFPAAFLTAADRKRRMHELVYTRNVSSCKLVFTRYAALVFTMFIPVFFEMIAALIQAMIQYKGQDLDMGIMFTLPTFWLLPILMCTTAAGVLITEIFSAVTAIFAQVVIWFLTVMMSSNMLVGQIGKFTLVCRHNSAGERAAFLAAQDNFIFSRFFWAAVSLVIIAAAAAVYEAKREGRFNGFKLFGEGGLLRRQA